MIIKTCLLVTDDPDDHQAFSEAISQVSEDKVVLIVLDSQKALSLMMTKTCLPYYIFLDLSMHGIRINSFLKIIKGETAFNHILIIIYGEEWSFDKIENKRGLIFFKKEYEYSELLNFLKQLFKDND